MATKTSKLCYNCYDMVKNIHRYLYTSATSAKLNDSTSKPAVKSRVLACRAAAKLLPLLSFTESKTNNKKHYQ